MFRKGTVTTLENQFGQGSNNVTATVIIRKLGLPQNTQKDGCNNFDDRGISRNARKEGTPKKGTPKGEAVVWRSGE